MSNELEIRQWLNCDVRIAKKVSNIEADLSNGFLYKEIFMRLGLPSSTLIQDKKDEATVKANYAAVSSILRDRMKITLQPRSGQHIEVLKQIYKFYAAKLQKTNEIQGVNSLGNGTIGQGTGRPTSEGAGKEETLIEQFNKSLKSKDKHLKGSFNYDEHTHLQMNLPPKILDIENKLEKFRQQKLKSEILAKTMKDQEIERDNEWRIEHRQFEINKVRTAHQYLAEKTATIKTNWQKTQDTRALRLHKEAVLNDFLTNRLKDNVVKENQELFTDYKQGLDYFKENCLHQGISLSHDPDDVKPPPKSNFNMNAAMTRIREKTHKNILARKDKEKRKNRMMVEQEKYEKFIEAKKKESDMLAHFIQVSQQGAEEAHDLYTEQQKERMVIKLRIARENNIQEERIAYFDAKHEQFREESIANEKIRKAEWKEKRFEYMERNLEKKIQSRAKHEESCLEILDIILDLTEVCHMRQRNESTIRVKEQYWRDLMTRFAEGAPLTDQNVMTIFDSTQSKPPALQNDEKAGDINNQLSLMFGDYNHGYSMWQPLHEFQEEENQILNHAYNDDELGDFLHEVIDRIHPKALLQAKPNDVADHMPLRMSIIGERFSGKKAISSLLKQKYGLNTIDVNEVIESAIKYAFPPVEDENEKKKALAKKGAKKGAVEEEKPDNPLLRALGEEAKGFQDRNEPFDDSILVKAAIVQIKAQFPVLSQDELQAQVTESKVKEAERITALKKEWEEIQKKKEKLNPKKAAAAPAKKDSKQEEQTISVEPVQETTEEAIYRLMSEKAYDYSEGYVLLNFPTNLNQAKLLEKGLTGFVPELERLNEQGEALKEEIGLLIRGSDKQPDTTPRVGALDLVILLSCDPSVAERRAANRRIDPQTGIIYNLEDNQPSAEEKGLVDRIQPMDAAKASAEEIVVSNQKIAQELESGLFDWFSQFGIERVKLGDTLESQADQGDASMHKLTTEKEEQVEGGATEDRFFHSLLQQEANSRRVEVFEEIDKSVHQLLLIRKQKIETQIAQLQLEKERLAIEQEQIRLKKEEELKQQQENEKNASSTDEAAVEPKENEIVNNTEPATEKSEKEILEQEKLTWNQSLNQVPKQCLQTLMEMWNETQNNYVSEVKQSLGKLDSHREVISNRLGEVQFRFLSIIQRPDDKQHKISTFQESLSKFFGENPMMLRFQNTKEELSQHLEVLYEGLWDSVDAKKSEAVNERKTIMSSGWFDSEISVVISTYMRLFQLELNKLGEILELILFLSDSLEDKPINEVREHIILDPFPNGIMPEIQDPSNAQSFPRVDQIFNHFLEKVTSIHNLIFEIRNRFLKKRGGNSRNSPNQISDHLLELYESVLSNEKGICLYRGYILKFTLISRIRELRLMEDALYSRLDDWIVFGLKHENEVIYEAIRILREAIKSSKPVENLVVNVKNISDSYRILQCFNQVPASLQPYENIDANKNPHRFSIFSLKLLFEEMHSLCDKRDYIHLKLFDNVFSTFSTLIHTPQSVRNSEKTPQVLPDIWVNLRQFVTDGKIEFKDIMLCFFLMESQLPDQQALDSLKDSLSQFSNSGFIENHGFLQIPQWFDETEKDDSLYDGIKFDRIICLKQLIFDLFAERDPYILSPAKYVESIRRLSSLGKSNFWQIIFQHS